MKTDEFWKLAWKTGEMTTSAPGEGWIKRYVDYAFLDDDLWVIAQNEVTPCSSHCSEGIKIFLMQSDKCTSPLLSNCIK